MELMKYKLLKDYPPYKKGDIIDNNEMVGYYSGKENYSVKFSIVEENPDFFVPYVFTTEDGVDMYVGDECLYINEDVSDIYCIKGNYSTKRTEGYKFFSTEEARDKYLSDLAKKKTPEWVRFKDNKNHGKLVFKVKDWTSRSYCKLEHTKKLEPFKELVQEATEAEIAAHKLGFHIGDKIWAKKDSEYCGQITGFKYSNVSKKLAANIDIYQPHEDEYILLEVATNKEPQLIGFKKFREEWETEQIQKLCSSCIGCQMELDLKEAECKAWIDKNSVKQKGSDLDVEKTCDTCNLASQGEARETYPCNMCTVGMGYEDHYQPKEPEFEIDKWYKHKKAAIYLLYNGTKWGKGFRTGRWVDKWKIEYEENWKLADMKEVKKLLKEKAKKDYPEGTKFRNLDTNSIRTVEKASHSYWKDTNRITCGKTPMYEWEAEQSNPYLFKDGKWAEIVEDPKLMLGDEKVTVVRKETDDPQGYSYSVHIVWTEKGSVTIYDWLEWFNVMEVLHEHDLKKDIKVQLGQHYKSTFSKNEGIEIGCIKQITYDQLKAVTEAVKKL